MKFDLWFAAKVHNALESVQRPLRRHITQQPGAAFSLASELVQQLVPAYRMKWPQMEWWDDPHFTKFLTYFEELPGFNSDRRWMVYQLLRLVAEVPGDLSECGSWRGCGSWLLSLEAVRRNATHFIFDSFEGVSAPVERDGSFWTEGALAAGEDVVARNLQPHMSNVVMYKGWIPDRFPEVDDRRFAFVHVDVDLYRPTLDSIAFFYDRLNVGGIIVCDDYGFSTCPGATAAVDEFLRDKPEKMIALADGGGFMIKGVATGPALDMERSLAAMPPGFAAG